MNFSHQTKKIALFMENFTFSTKRCVVGPFSLIPESIKASNFFHIKSIYCKPLILRFLPHYSAARVFVILTSYWIPWPTNSWIYSALYELFHRKITVWNNTILDFFVHKLRIIRKLMLNRVEIEYKNPWWNSTPSLIPWR